MNRITHSNSGFLRYIQISDKPLFSFIEGKTHDQYFYDRLCHAVCNHSGVEYEQVAAYDLPGGTGGKNAILNYYEYLRRRHFLRGKFKGKKKVCVFFVDKDIDDLLRQVIRSPHVIYTAHYDLENHLFVEGNLIDATAAAASLRKAVVEKGMGSPHVWRRTKADLWKQWIKLCIFVRVRRLNCASNYRLVSRVNTPPNGPFDKMAWRREMATIEVASGLKKAQSAALFKKISVMVDRIYAAGKHDQVFKGKWYSKLLEMDMPKIAAPHRYDANGLGDRVSHAIMITIDYDGPCCKYFKSRLRPLVRFLS